MIYKPDFKAIRILVGFVTVLGIWILYIAISGKVLWLAFIGVAIVFYFPVVNWRVRIIIHDDYFEYYGIFRKFCLPWKEIKQIYPMYKYGYPADRLYGMHVYELRTTNSNKRSSKKINFLYFTGAINGIIMKEIEKRISGCK